MYTAHRFPHLLFTAALMLIAACGSAHAASLPTVTSPTQRSSSTTAAGLGGNVTSGDLKTWTTSGVTLSAPDANHIRTASVPTTGASCFMRLVVGY